MTCHTPGGRAPHRPDRRSGAEFSDAVLCEAACQAVLDALFGEEAPAAGQERDWPRR